MGDKKKSTLGGISTQIYEKTTSAISRFRNWVSRREEDYDEKDDVLENSFALKSILKKNDKNTARNWSKAKGGRFQQAMQEMVDLMSMQTKRRERERGRTRRGPMPIDEIPVSERGPSKLTHATLNPSILTRRQSEDEETQLPSNRGLLTYFARIGQTSSEGESVDLIFVKSLLSAGADVNIGDKYGQTIMHAIARDWHVDIAKYIISRGSDVNIRDKFGRTPLHVAAAVNYPEMIEFLVKNGANINAKTDGELQTATHFAAKFDAVESLKCLLKLGAKVSDRDYKDRSPLFLAAEQGRRDVVKFLLNLGVAAAAYDDQGNCAVSLMIEKMPDLANLALDQFIIEDKPNRRHFFYLCSLEYDMHCKLGHTPARSVLETVLYKEDKTLIQHCAVQKLIDVKWNLLAKYKAFFEIAVNFIYACVVTGLAVTLDTEKIYNPLSKKGWRIGVEVLFILMTLFFTFKQGKTTKRANGRHSSWQTWRIDCISQDLKYCHPQWPEEKRYLKEEIERIRDMSCSHSTAWVYYEWISLAAILSIIITQIACVTKPSKQFQFALTFSYLIEVFLVWLHLLKPCKTVQALSGLIVMLGDIAKGSIQYMYVFLEFFVPLAVAFYIMFGGEENIKLMEAKKVPMEAINSYNSFAQMTFTLYWVTFGGPFGTEALQAVDRKSANVMISILFAIMKIVAANLFISLMSYLFQRVYNNARATALLQSANFIQLTERNLGVKESKRYRKKIRREYNPLETYETNLVRLNQQEKEFDENINNITRQLDQLEIVLSQENGEKPQETNREEMHAVKLVMSCVEDMTQKQGDFGKCFKEQWEKILQNQNTIKGLLSRPEVAAHILKVSGNKKEGFPSRKRSSSSESIRSTRSR